MTSFLLNKCKKHFYSSQKTFDRGFPIVMHPNTWEIFRTKRRNLMKKIDADIFGSIG